ncbi:YcgJ family protein [Polynucleobacter necessarius]|uniref:YcgJ family protein n=1 Tax=Polynucleobacter necessarius TaxID=576610 RepID=UPI000E09766C|nr:YcgJ family protein [Polynucleobacter necessarius]
MKITYKSSFVIGALLISLCQSIYAQSKPNSAITFPKPGGVICDKKSGFCADDQGVSVAITEMELGSQAAKNLMNQINQVGLKDFDATSFTMSGGLHCETKQKNVLPVKMVIL